MAIFGPSSKPVTRQISKTVHYPHHYVLCHGLCCGSCHGSCSGFVVVHGGSWWFSCGGFLVACGGSVVVVSWWFVVVFCGGFSPKISRERSCDPLFNQSETQIHYEISFLMRLTICPFPFKEHTSKELC